MNITILGSGHVGQTLAEGFLGAGHAITIASRSGDKLGEFSARTGIPELPFDRAAAGAELVVLAVKGTVAQELVTGLASGLAGKVVIDTTNPIAGAPVGGVLPYFTGPGDSLLQRLQQAVPAGRFVKAFNSVGAGLMVQPALQGGRPTMFICGDDSAAKTVVAGLCEQLGWQAEDVGTSAAGGPVEALCQLWCAAGFLRNDWTHAFAWLRP
jgi:predicted dinucleotide-binding enzyme